MYAIRSYYRSKVLVHAEGTPGDEPTVTVSDYEQHAVIAEVSPTPPHNRRAWERFTPDGPLALLPLGDEYSVVFTLPPRITSYNVCYTKLLRVFGEPLIASSRWATIRADQQLALYSRPATDSSN